jgi:hypothetical protein
LGVHLQVIDETLPRSLYFQPFGQFRAVAATYLNTPPTALFQVIANGICQEADMQM